METNSKCSICTPPDLKTGVHLKAFECFWNKRGRKVGRFWENVGLVLSKSETRFGKVL